MGRFNSRTLTPCSDNMTIVSYEARLLKSTGLICSCGRVDSVLPNQEQGRALLRQGQPGPCCRVGGHDPPAPALHGASICLTPFGSDGSPAPGTSSDSQHGKHRKLAGSDAVAVRYPGKPACQPAIRSEDSGSLSSPPP